MIIQKQTGKPVCAWQLGRGSNIERRMIAAGRIILHDDGQYELFSQESVNGHGQMAQAGDYFKIDCAGFPYPNERSWFEAHHEHVRGDEYLQKPEHLEAWVADEPMCPQMRFLLDSGKLIIDPERPDKYFSAILWGAPLSAARDAVIVFYKTDYDADGSICDVEFNFVERSEFEKTYCVVA